MESTPAPAVPAQGGPTSYRQIVKSSALTGGSTLVDVALRIARVKVLAVILGPQGVGLIGLYTSIVQTATAVATLGVETSGVREIANAQNSGDHERTARVTAAVRTTLCFSGLLGTIALCVFATPLSVLSFGRPDYKIPIIIVSASVFLGSVLASFRAEIQGYRKIGDLALVSVIGSTLGTFVTVMMVWLWGTRAIAPLITVSAGVSAIATWWIARRLPTTPSATGLRELLPNIKTLLRLGFAFLFSAVAGNAIAYFSRVIITRNLGADYTGYYQAASALAVLYVGFIIQAMGTDFFPRLSQAANAMESNRLVNEQTEVGLLLAAPGVMGTLTFAPVVIHVFYSPAFFQSVDVLRWQVLAVFLQVLTWPMGYVLPALGMARAFLYTEIVAYAIQAFFIWAGLKTWGLVGAGVGYFAYYIVYGILIFAVVRAHTGFSFSSRNIRLAAFAIPGITLVFLAQYYLPHTAAIAVGTVLTVATGIYVLNSLKKLLSTRGQLATGFLGRVERVYERAVNPFFRWLNIEA